jgi:hypothetical protein
MKKLRVNTADASYDQLKRIAEKCGFRVVQRRRHCRVETLLGEWITDIPRHNKVKRPTAKGIAGRYNLFGGNVEII